MPTRVFISYTHDSEDHRASVLHLARALQRDGVEVILDQGVPGTPAQGWPAWMEDEVEAADFILIVCSARYYERYRGRGDQTQGRGGRWESNLIRDDLYSDRSHLTRFVPVLAEGAVEGHVPDPLRHSVTRYRLGQEDYDDLFRFLTGQHADPLPPLGPLRVLPPHTEVAATGVDPSLAATAEPRTSLVVGQIPGEPQSYVERALVERLATELDRSNVVVVTALTGMRGVGKTQVAAAYARQAVRERCRLVGWVNADSAANLTAGLARIAERLSISAPQAEPEESAHLLREHLSTWDEQSVLVLDNASNPDVVGAFLPPTGRSRIVITSTDRSFDELAAVIDVSTYERNDSVDYLHRRTRLADDAGADAVAEELGDLPLALASAAAHIRHRQIGYERCLDDLRHYPVAQTLTAVRGIGYPDTTAAALLLAVDSVDTDDENRVAGTLLEIVATLSPEGVRRDLLARAVGASGQTWTSDVIDRALERCVTGSLLSWSESGDTVIMHRLMSRVIRERTDRGGRWNDAVSGALTLLEPGFSDTKDAWSERESGLHIVTQIQALSDSVLPAEPDGVNDELDTSND